MRILVAGASGFIGRRIAAALIGQGHEVVAGVRDGGRFPAAPGIRPLALDFSGLTRPEDWLPKLEGMDAVVNCVGIIAETGRNRFETLHTLAPIALFEACVRAGVRKVVQVSALGADETAFSRYHLSKKAADDALAETPLDWAILQPSLVYGPGGQSTALLTAIAALPVIPLIGDGGQQLQPVRVEDLAEAAVRILENADPLRKRLPVVGPEPMTLRELLVLLRRGLGLAPARTLSLPDRWVLTLADRRGRTPASPFNGETLRMLQQGNTADPGPLTALLGRPPATLAVAMIETPPSVRRPARLFFPIPALRITLGLLWVWSGVVSAGFHPKADSLALLAATGITGPAAPAVLYGAAAADVLLGLAWLFRVRVVAAGWLQILMMLAYSSVIAVFLPEFWLHPFAPLAKNIPLMAATLAVMATEDP